MTTSATLSNTTNSAIFSKSSTIIANYSSTSKVSTLNSSTVATNSTATVTVIKMTIVRSIQNHINVCKLQICLAPDCNDYKKANFVSTLFLRDDVSYLKI